MYLDRYLLPDLPKPKLLTPPEAPGMRPHTGKTLTIELPQLHAGQSRIVADRSRFKAIRCGRRWGKTVLLETVAGSGAANGKSIGIFAPQYKTLSESYYNLDNLLDPITTQSRDSTIIRTISNGTIDFWTLDSDKPGRGRKYHDVLIDEAAFTKKNMLHIWKTAIKPTLLDYRGRAWVMSTTKGEDGPDNFFYEICNDPVHGFKDFHAPSSDNPYNPPEELLEIERTEHPLVWRQEYLAEFVDWSGIALFDLSEHCDTPEHCDAVFAVVDSALKAERKHDGTAVMYFALSKFPGPGKPKLVVLDWSIHQIEGAFLNDWLPGVLGRAEDLAKLSGARGGFIGAFIEDKASGTMLLQNAAAAGLPTRQIDPKLTAMGKDGRAREILSVVYRKEVAFSHEAYSKVSEFKGKTMNHALQQIQSYRLGDPNATTRADDLLDTFTYGVLLGLVPASG